MADVVRSIDLTGRIEPALSTTSDMPKPGKVIPPKPGAVSQEEIDAGGTEALKAKKAEKAETKDDKKETKESKSETTSDSDETKEIKTETKTDTKEEPKDDTPPWMKREMTKARNRQREAESRAQALEERLDKALTALERAASRTDTDVKTQPADPRPKRADFDDPDKYEEALVTWSASSAAKLTQAEVEKKQKERTEAETREKTEKEQQAFAKERIDAWGKAKEKAIEKYPDFEEIAEADDVQITKVMAAAIVEENMESGEGYEISYYLGKHQEEAAKIAALHWSQQPIAIGRLAERLEAERKKPPPVTKVPKAPTPLGSRSSAGGTEQEPDMNSYAANHSDPQVRFLAKRK